MQDARPRSAGIAILPVSMTRRAFSALAPVVRTEPTENLGDLATISFRLAVTRAGIGMELARPFRHGLFQMEDIALTLPALRFPVDLSGGVSRFRHHRGQLTRLRFSLEQKNLAFWATSLLDRGACLGHPGAALAVSVCPAPGGWLIGLQAEQTAVAWRLGWVPDHQTARLVVYAARGINLPFAAHGVALRVMQTLTRPWATFDGSWIRFEHAVARMLRDILPRAGARVADSQSVRWTGLATDEKGWILAADETAILPDLERAVLVACEAAALALDADTALAAGDQETARIGYLNALEKAPQQEEIVRRLADLDLAHGDRAEAALSTLRTALVPTEAGSLGAQILRGVGDGAGACRAFAQAGEQEIYPALAALCFAEAAHLCSSPGERGRWLAAATHRAPTNPSLRWERLHNCLDLADRAGAVAEAEHLSAVTQRADRYKVVVRLGQAFVAYTYWDEAIRWYEAALRFHPSGYDALLGLGVACAGKGKAERAAYVLGRAVDLANRLDVSPYGATLALAKVLADGIGDVPSALGRLGTIPAGVEETVDARTLEGRYWVRLGDRTAASLAYGRLHDAIAHGTSARVPERAAAALVEAASFERDQRGELDNAKRYLGLALQFRSRDPELLASFREVAQALEDEDRELRRRAEPLWLTPDKPVSSDPTMSPLHAAASIAESPAESLASDEEQVEALTAHVRADPNDTGKVMQLAGVFERLGRDLELFALLSARLEDGDEAVRTSLLPLQRCVLERLAAHAHSDGRHVEAQLYEASLAAMNDEKPS